MSTPEVLPAPSSILREPMHALLTSRGYSLQCSNAFSVQICLRASSGPRAPLYPQNWENLEIQKRKNSLNISPAVGKPNNENSNTVWTLKQQI
jgi:hypothetical protein